jgi:hypothetical protein
MPYAVSLPGTTRVTVAHVPVVFDRRLRRVMTDDRPNRVQSGCRPTQMQVGGSATCLVGKPNRQAGAEISCTLVAKSYPNPAALLTSSQTNGSRTIWTPSPPITGISLRTSSLSMILMD